MTPWPSRGFFSGKATGQQLNEHLGPLGVWKWGDLKRIAKGG
jgi:hypothetical protein